MSRRPGPKPASSHVEPLARGIAPALLLSQVQGTMPYLFAPERAHDPLTLSVPAQVVLELARDPAQPLSHEAYYRLCLCAHFLTVGTPVPTDVDNQIRKKLWHPSLPPETALAMGNLVLEARHWPLELLSPRFQKGAAGSPWAAECISGHLGEWFTVATGAYAGLEPFSDPGLQALRTRLLTEIGEEVRRHVDIFDSLWQAQDGLGCLRASASLAHNLGDLDRVIDQWALGPADPLRALHYKLGASWMGHDGELRYQGTLWCAGELYKTPFPGGSMASENHRHFALRKPRILRTHPALRVPIGPFLDDWGRLLLTHLPPGSLERSEGVEALVEGWMRLPGVTSGYGRALHALFLDEGFRGALKPLKDDKQKRRCLELSQEAFESRWSELALKRLEELRERLSQKGGRA